MDNLPFCGSFSDDLFLSSSSAAHVDRKSKKAKRMERFNTILEKRRQKRTVEHKRRRQRKAEGGVTPHFEIPTLTVAIDFGFCSLMSVKELRKLSRQIGRVWGLQKRFKGLHTSLISPADRFLVECRRTMDGFDGYGWEVSHNSVLNRFCDGEQIIYLSPDPSLSPLLELHNDCVYVIGGLVDESGKGSQTKSRAEEMRCSCYRLPIVEFMQKKDKGSFNVMLPINQVVEILCKFAYSNDWTSALGEVIPRRTGFYISNV